MPRPGEAPITSNTNYVTLPTVPVSKKLNAAKANYIASKVLEPQLAGVFSVSVTATDEIVFPEYTQSGALAFVKDAAVVGGTGEGNGIEGIILSDGNAITFSGDFFMSTHALVSGQRYHLKATWNGEAFVGFLHKIGILSINVPSPSYTDLAVTANNTSGDGQASGASVTDAILEFHGVDINGLGAEVGDAVKTKDCYFSADAGVTAKALSAISQADVLYWNGVIAGHDLVNTMKISIKYDI
jgi:hypothetical protein